MERTDTLPDDAPPPTERRRILVALGIALVVQLVVPLTYYARDDRYDERFAWRMFSAIRVERCRASAGEVRRGEARTLPLERLVHGVWERHMERQRMPVIERFLERRCDDGATTAYVRNTCRDASGLPTPEIRYTLDCATRTITVTGR